MPQMAPMMWQTMFITCNLIMLVMMVKIFFSANAPRAYSKGTNIFATSFSWKW